MIEHVNPSLVWTAVSTVGGAFAAYGAWDAYQDLRSLLPSERNGRRRIARGTFRSQSLRAAVQVVWIGVGLMGLAYPIATQWTPHAIALVATNLTLTYAAIADVRDRVRGVHHPADIERRVGEIERSKAASHLVVDGRLDALEHKEQR